MPATPSHNLIRILIFEHNAADADIIVECLKSSQLDCDISMANNLSEGIGLIRQNSFDVILLNLSLPDSQGIDTLKSAIAKVANELIIVLHNSDNEALALESLKVGAQDYLVKKQLSTEGLQRAICFAIERTRLLIQSECDKAEIQKLSSISLLAGGIAHDFNNLLSAVIGNISMVRIGLREDDKNNTKLMAAEKAALQARSLTQQLLTLSKGGTHILEFASLTDIVKECAQFILRGSNVNFHMREAENLWPIRADQGQISQVVNNLIINADQAMPNGGIIKIHMRNLHLRDAEVPTLDSGDYVCIDFHDEGTGIPPENLKRIFDPYFTTKEDGNGIGLASSSSIISRHGGTITAKSSVGSGSLFSVYLPKSHTPKDSQKPPPKRPAKVTTKEKIHHGKGRILVMDDMDAMMLVAGEIITVLGYDVDYSTNGEEAINAYKNAKESGNPFNAVVFDLTVPGEMGGEEAANILIQYDPNLIAIASSGYTTSNVMSDYKNSPFSAVIPKPYRIKEMSDTLHAVLK